MNWPLPLQWGVRALLGPLLLIQALATPALANGAMGLGMEMWDLRYWYAYVGAMVVTEAWLIGTWLGVGWPKSLALSLLANLMTGFLCGAGGLCAPVLHMTLAGSSANPNPLLNSVYLLVMFALPSAFFEYLIWSRARPAERSERGFLWRVTWVHLATIPLALAILLIPERPYIGLEATTGFQRRYLLGEIEDALQGYIEKNHAVPRFKSFRELLNALKPHLDVDAANLEFAFYRPHLNRFAIGEDWSRPLEVNSRLLGRKIVDREDGRDQEWVWFVRPPDDGSRYQWGLSVDVTWGQVKLTNSLEMLGYRSGATQTD